MAYFEKRETKKGTKIRVTVRLSGFPSQRKTFDRMTDARIWAEETERAIKKGEFHNVLKEAKTHTLQKTIERYKKEILPFKAKNTQRAESSYLKWWDKELGEYALSYIKPEIISEKMYLLSTSGDTRRKDPEREVKPKAPKTLKLYQTQLEMLFNHAKQWGWIGTNPVDGVNKIKRINNARVRYLDDDERKALLESCKNSPNKLLYPIVIFALSTGARLGEITKLTLKDVDLNRHVAILRDTKNGETRSVPILGHLEDVLIEHMKFLEEFYSERPSIKTRWLFPRSDGLKAIDIRKAWEIARDKAEIKDFRFHDLRHSAASYLAMNGATLLEIATVLGHKTLQMVQRYSHLSEDHTAKIVGKMNKNIFSDN